MAARPTEFINWNPSLSNVVEPPGGQKSTGWIGGQEPPAQFFNWIINLTDQWIQYFATNSGGWPSATASSEADLASALTAAGIAGGGVILISGSFTLSAAYTVPSGTILLGRAGEEVITFLAGGSLIMADESDIRELTMDTMLSSGTLIDLSGSRCNIRNCKITVPVTSSIICVEVTGSNNLITRSNFIGVVGTPAIGIDYAGGAQNKDEDCIFQ